MSARFAPGAWRRASIGALVPVLPAILVAESLLLLSVLAALGVLWFHRDPSRESPSRGIVSPADGRITVIRAEGDRVRVGIFMGLRDVHINRAPAGGTVESVEHVPGGHLPAFSKEAERNERLHIDYGRYKVTLIAGTVARRIWPYVEPGASTVQGQRIAHVTFGSRADVLLPPGTSLDALCVEKGQTVRAGETVLLE